MPPTHEGAEIGLGGRLGGIMSQGPPGFENAAHHGPVMLEEMTIELGVGRIDYVTKLLIAALARDPYLRAPVTDGLTWPQLRPMAQELINRKLDADGAAARRWTEVSEAVAAVTASVHDPSVNRAELGRHLSDVGTELLNVLHLSETELSAKRTG